MISKILVNQKNGVFYLTPPKVDFEKSYTEVRSKENRLLADEVVIDLPIFREINSNQLEWQKRAFTLLHFQRYLAHQKPKNVLEIGCGNGWFAAKIAKFSDKTIAVDVCKNELEQAARCFKNENIHFVCCADLSLLPEKTFDLIVFNASVQYFNLDSKFWNHLDNLLTQKGEIHLLDSPIYSSLEVSKAKDRSIEYFQAMESPEAINYYNHTTWQNLPAGYSILYRPNKWMMKLFKKRSPFPWIQIHKRA